MTMADTINPVNAVLIYTTTTSVAPHICWIKPNTITFIHGLLLPILLAYNMHHHRTILEFVALIFLRTWLDALDGSVARACGTGTPNGQAVDDTFDMLGSIFLVGFVVLKVELDKKTYLLGVLVALIAISAVANAIPCDGERSASGFCWFYHTFYAGIHVILAATAMVKYSSMKRFWKQNSVPKEKDNNMNSIA